MSIITIEKDGIVFNLYLRTKILLLKKMEIDITDVKVDNMILKGIVTSKDFSQNYDNIDRDISIEFTNCILNTHHESTAYIHKTPNGKLIKIIRNNTNIYHDFS